MAIKLSIGTAVYNLEESYLRAHIEGLLGQLNDESELLLIDDCSTNNSGEVCREYAARDSRIRYIKMEQNGGLSRVRNRTIKEARGKWIFFADGDDLLSEYFVQTALSFAQSEADIIIHERLKFTQEVQAQLPCEVKQLKKLSADAGRKIGISCLCLDPNITKELGLPSRAFYHAAWGGLYRKEFLLENNLLFPEGQKKAQDAVFNTQAYFYAKNIEFLPYIMYFYRVNEFGITQRYTESLTEVLCMLLGHLNNCKKKLFEEDEDVEKRFVQHRILASVVDNLRLNFFHKDNKKSKEVKKREFLEFVQTEPFKTALETYDPSFSGRWEWHLPLTLAKRRSFGLLRLFVSNPKIYRLSCALDKRVIKLCKRR